MYLPQNVFTVSLFALSKATHAIVYISLYTCSCNIIQNFTYIYKHKQFMRDSEWKTIINLCENSVKSDR